MLKKELVSHYLVTLIWLVIISLLRWQWQIDLIWFWLGGFIGTFLLDLDQFLYALYIYPQESSSLKIQEFFKQKKYHEGLFFLVSTAGERTRLAFHNAVFQVILYGFCFWVLTSSVSLLGQGLVMAMALHLLKDEFELLLGGKNEFLNRLLFWQIKRPVTFKEQKLFVVLMLLVFFGLNLLLI